MRPTGRTQAILQFLMQFEWQLGGDVIMSWVELLCLFHVAVGQLELFIERGQVGRPLLLNVLRTFMREVAAVASASFRPSQGEWFGAWVTGIHLKDI
eukprot:480680-Alexandrium_andersonii.AAC.1